MTNLSNHKKLIITSCVAVVAISGASFYAGSMLTKDKEVTKTTAAPKKAAPLTVTMLASDNTTYINQEVEVKGKLIKNASNGYSIFDPDNRDTAGYQVDVSKLDKSPEMYFTGKGYDSNATPNVLIVKGVFSGTVSADGNGITDIKLVASSISKE